MRQILELAKKRADKAEIFQIRKSNTPVCFFGNRLSSIEGEETISTCLRVIVNGKLGFSSTTHPDDKEELVNRAINAARLGPDVDFQFPRTTVNRKNDPTFYDEKINNISETDLIEMGRLMIEIVKSKFPKVNLELEVSKEISEISLINSNGGEFYYNKTLFRAFLNVLLMLSSDRIELEHTTSSTHYSSGPQRLAEDAVWRFSNCKKVIPIETKRMTVVFTSLGFRGLFVPLFFGFNGDLVNRKLSLLTGKLGEKVLNENVTITDDATISGFPGSCPIDDEGSLTRKNILIKNGVLQNYLYDLRSAASAGVESTANGFKKSSLYTGFSIDAQPSPYPSNLIISGGRRTKNELIKSIKDGIIVDDTMGAGQGNNLNGEFSMNVALGYRIVNGEIVGRVKDVMVAGNVFDIMKSNISEVSLETYVEDTLFGRYSVPWIVFEDMMVSAT